jgi:hypothetical protein
MNKTWLVFWKIFAFAICAAVAAAIVAGITVGAGIGYSILKNTFTASIGVCGVIGIMITPIELYFLDKAEREKNK